jgi:hypothetical protein
MAHNLLHHPDELDGVVENLVFLHLAHHLLHHRGKLNGVESATPKKRERGACVPIAVSSALAAARSKIGRLLCAGFALSRNDRKIILYGQLLTTLTAARDAATFASIVNAELAHDGRASAAPNRAQQQLFFGRV